MVAQGIPIKTSKKAATVLQEWSRKITATTR
jgi:hypothetical protein